MNETNDLSILNRRAIARWRLDGARAMIDRGDPNSARLEIMDAVAELRATGLSEEDVADALRVFGIPRRRDGFFGRF